MRRTSAVSDEPVRLLDFRYPQPGALPMEIGRLERMHPMARSPRAHRHSFYEIVWFTRGDGEHQIDFRTYAIAPDTVFFITPGQVQSVRLTGPVGGVVVLFTEEFLGLDPRGQELLRTSPLFLPGGRRPTMLTVDPSRAGPFGTLLAMEREFDLALPDRAAMLRAQLSVFLLSLGRLVAASGRMPDTYPPLVRQFYVLAEETVGQAPRINALAARLAVSPGHLNDMVKQATGVTAGSIVRERTVLEGKRLLLHSDLSVAEIARRLGFEDSSYFGRYFRREVGESPGAFRLTSREKYQSDREQSLVARA